MMKQQNFDLEVFDFKSHDAIKENYKINKLKNILRYKLTVIPLLCLLVSLFWIYKQGINVDVDIETLSIIILSYLGFLSLIEFLFNKKISNYHNKFF